MRRLVVLTALCALMMSVATSADEESVAECEERPFAFQDAPVASGNTEMIDRLREMSSREVERTICVSADHPAADDENDGTRSEPVRTLARAAELAIESLNAGIPTRIYIMPGEYSGNVSISRGAMNETGASTLLVIQGAGADETVLTALTSVHQGVSYAADTWSPVDGHPNVYVHDWPNPQAPYAGPWANDYGQPFQNLATRGELIAVNERVLMPVNLERLIWVDPDGRRGQPGRLEFRGIEEGGLNNLNAPYTFMVATHPEAPEEFRNKVFIRLPEGAGIASADIRIGRPGSVLAISGKSNVVIKDLSIRHSAGNMLTAGLSINNCSNVVLENIEATWNNGCGMNLRSVTNMLAVGVIASDNGYKGLGGGGLNHVMFNRLTAARNNWRGLRGGWTGWDAAGFKMGGNSHDVLLVNPVFVGNHTGGLWLDVFCTDVAIESLFSYGNRGAGLWLELSHPNQGRYEVRDSVIARNGWLGLAIWDVANVWAHDNVIVDNGTNVRFSNDGRPPNETNQFGVIRMNDNLVVDYGQDGHLIQWTGATDKMLRATEQFDNQYYFDAEGRAVRVNDRTWEWDAFMEVLQDRAPNGQAERNSTWADPGLGPVDFTDPDNAWYNLATERGIDVPVELIRAHHGQR